MVNLLIAMMVVVACLVWLGLQFSAPWPSKPKTTITTQAINPPKDEPVVFAECNNKDILEISLLMRDAMLGGRGKYYWVEARGKKGDAETLQIVAHTTPKDSGHIE